MRILVVHNRYRWSGGEERTVERLVAALRESGESVELFSPSNPRRLLASLGSTLVAPWSRASFARTQTAIAEFRPDVVHVHNTWFELSPSVFAACVDSSVPVVTTVQNYRLVCPQAHLVRNDRPCTDCVGRLPLPGLRHRCYRGSFVLSAISALTTHLNARLGTWDAITRVHVPALFAQQVLEAGPFDNKKFVVFPNGSADPGVRRRPPSASNRILFVGRLSEEKGLDIVLEAWKRLRPPELTLTVVGDGPARSDLEDMATSDVEFRGRLSSNEVTALMLDSRALVFPSRWFEVCPLVIVEALSAGLPVIGHDLGAVTELIEFGAPHSLVGPADESGWDGALTMLRDDRLVDELGRRARDAYLARHTIPDWVAAHTKMYAEALA